jgi:hypothetical protein
MNNVKFQSFYDNSLVNSGTNAFEVRFSTNLRIFNNRVSLSRRALVLNAAAVQIDRNEFCSNNQGIMISAPGSDVIKKNNFQQNITNLYNIFGTPQNVSSNWWGGPTLSSYRTKAFNNGSWSNAQPWRLSSAFDLTPGADVDAPETPVVVALIISNSIRLNWTPSVSPDISRYNIYSVPTVKAYTNTTHADVLYSTALTSYKPVLPFGDYVFHLTALDDKNVTNESFYSAAQSIAYWPIIVSNISPAPTTLNVATNINLVFDIGSLSQVVSNEIVVRVNGLTALSNGLHQGAFTGTSSALQRNASAFRVTLDPLLPLAQNSNFSVTLQARSFSGMTIATSWNFATADTTSPTFNAVTPFDQQTNISKSVILSFSVSDNIGINSNAIVARIKGSTALSNGAFFPGFTGFIVDDGSGKGWNVQISPVAAFVTNEVVTVQYQAMDISSFLVVTNFSFTVSRFVPPVIVLLSPTNNATLVETNVSLLVRVTSINSFIDTNSIILRIAGATAYSNGTFQIGFQGIGSVLMIATNGWDIMVDPQLPLVKNTSQSVYVSVFNTANLQSILNASFTTRDYITPTTVSFKTPEKEVAFYPTLLDLSLNSKGIIVVKNIGTYSIEIRNVRGDIVRTFSERVLSPGDYVEWDGRNDENQIVSAGVYVIILKSKKSTLSTKMILRK